MNRVGVEWADLEGWNNNWNSTDPAFEPIFCVAYMSQDWATPVPLPVNAHHEWHDNTATAGKSFIGTMNGWIAIYFFTGYENVPGRQKPDPNDWNPMEHLTVTGVNLPTLSDYAAIKAHAQGGYAQAGYDGPTGGNANSRQSFLVYNNTLSNMRAIVEHTAGNGTLQFGWDSGQASDPLAIMGGHVVAIMDNDCTDVEVAQYFHAFTAVTPALYDRYKDWQRVENNGVDYKEVCYCLNWYPSNPEVREDMTYWSYVAGKVPFQQLAYFPKVILP